MATKTRTTEYEKLCKRLGELDKERREVLKALRDNPQYVLKIVNDKLNNFIKNGQWYSRKNALNQESYFSLVSFTIIEKSIKKTEHGSIIIKVDLTWDYYDYISTEKKKAVEGVLISAFNEIDQQILNGRQLASKFSENVIKRNILTAQKKELEEKLKKIKEEIAKV